jgi:DDE superfamily endonuclease
VQGERGIDLGIEDEGVFTMLATGMVAQTGRRSVVGMLAGARMAGAISFHAACRFFSQAVWEADRLGLLEAGAPVVVVVDDTLLRRWAASPSRVLDPLMGPPRANRRSAGATGG